MVGNRWDRPGVKWEHIDRHRSELPSAQRITGSFDRLHYCGSVEIASIYLSGEGGGPGDTLLATRRGGPSVLPPLIGTGQDTDVTVGCRRRCRRRRRLQQHGLRVITA